MEGSGLNEGVMYEKFLGKHVDIGIPNFVHPNRLFLISGVVISVERGFVTLKIRDGYRKIPYQDVIQIREGEGIR